MTIIRYVAYWLLTELSIRDFLHKTHLWKLAEAVTWLKGNVWVLWNDICRWHSESQCWACGQKRFCKSQRAPANGWGPAGAKSPQQASNWVSPGREAEEVLSGALKIKPCVIVKRRSYGSIWQSVFVSPRPSVFLTPQKLWPVSRTEYESYIFI